VRADGEQEVDDEPDAGGDSDRRPEQPGDQAGRAREQEPGELVEPVLGLRCLERLPPEQVTARVIAAESGANLASIAYHFGSKDDLLTEAVILGLDRWLAEVDRALAALPADTPAERLTRAAEVIERTRRRHAGLARNFLGALAKAQHDPRVAELLAEGFRKTRPTLAAVLDLGGDQAGQDAAGLVHSWFTGLLFQQLLDPELGIEGDRLEAAKIRLRRALPG
jgi:AcrR family transcriptional regulator